eukprot:scaffold19495_cov102-Isochrysis_galbana.AAC.1
MVAAAIAAMSCSSLIRAGAAVGKENPRGAAEWPVRTPGTAEGTGEPRDRGVLRSAGPVADPARSPSTVAPARATGPAVLPRAAGGRKPGEKLSGDCDGSKTEPPASPTLAAAVSGGGPAEGGRYSVRRASAAVCRALPRRSHRSAVSLSPSCFACTAATSYWRARSTSRSVARLEPPNVGAAEVRCGGGALATCGVGMALRAGRETATFFAGPRMPARTFAISASETESPSSSSRQKSMKAATVSPTPGRTDL